MPSDRSPTAADAPASLYEALAWRRLEVAALPSSPLELRIGEVSAGEGPNVLISAGTHGDEGPWGALAIRALLERPLATLRGSLRIVMAANPLAAEADARNAPLDELDLNRSFPGDAEGSHTQRIAAALAPFVQEADVAIDLHGGGSWCVNAFAFRFPGGEDLAAAVGAPFVVDMPEKAGTLTREAMARGGRALAIEMGGRSRDEIAWRDRIAEALARVLVAVGALEPDAALPEPAESVPVGATRVLRPGRGGVFVPTLREDAVGTVVAGGTELGVLHDLHDMAPVERFVAPFERTALLLLRPHVAVLEGGAMTYVVAEPR